MPINETIEPAPEPTVTIRQSEYDSLREDSAFLNALVAAGVDNWNGYEEAQAILEEGE
jgi:hypothetical protein